MGSIKRIQMEGLVALKIGKYCEEDSNPEPVVGILLGMVENDRLEITNCFPFPRASDNSDFDETQYQLDIQKAHRNVNIDHLQVGWFQPAVHGHFVNKMFLESQLSYQSTIDESVAVIYDPLKTSKGCLSMKAYRIKKNMVELLSKQTNSITIEMLKEVSIHFDTMFEEIPIEIKVSPLAGILMNKLQRENPVPEKVEFLNLSHGSSLEQQLRLMMSSLDDVTQESGKFIQYQRMVAKYNQQKVQHQQRRANENATRGARGEPPLPDDFSKIPRPTQPNTRMEALLACKQVTTYCNQIKEFSGQGLSKVFMAEAMDNVE